MTVLLTGGAGYIGSHVAVELLQLGYDVIIADNFYNSSQEVPERIRKITGKSVRTYNVDIQNSADLEQIFKQHEINAVMHFAGYITSSPWAGPRAMIRKMAFWNRVLRILSKSS